MLNIKFKKSCLVRCVKDDLGISLNKIYKVIESNPFSICIYNDYGIKFWYNKKYFREEKSNEQK